LDRASRVGGAIPAGTFPREISVDVSRNRLLVTNFGSNQLEVVDARRLP
jgi:DNA-binding beta-propeller fold protein YncE